MAIKVGNVEVPLVGDINLGRREARFKYRFVDEPFDMRAASHFCSRDIVRSLYLLGIAILSLVVLPFTYSLGIFLLGCVLLKIAHHRIHSYINGSYIFSKKGQEEMAKFNQKLW